MIGGAERLGGDGEILIREWQIKRNPKYLGLLWRAEGVSDRRLRANE